MKKNILLPLVLLFVVGMLFFQPFILQRKLPIPSDTIIGLYHPFRDLYATDYPNGIPYKNFLITDPVRQQYPWRSLSFESLTKGALPLWNPYTMAGTPLLGNFQSASLYPLNILFLLFPFAVGWSFLILLQPLLAGVFLYVYLYNLRLNRFASILGGLTFSFSGFMVAWLEWGTIGQTALWLPLILLAIDKIYTYPSLRTTVKQSSQDLVKRRGLLRHFIPRNDVIVWSLVFVLSLVVSFLAGHLQTFFYLALVSATYLFARWFQFGKSIKILLLFMLLASCFLLLTFVQWFATFQFIAESARSVDQIDWHKPGWFIPWQHLVQFIAPDFFGNPTTLNYWGEWNYGEFVGYVGILPLILALFSLYTRRDKKTLFFGALFLVSLVFALPTVIASLPYQLHIPFLSTTQPTRLLFITDFALAVLAALGLDYYIKTNKKMQMLYAVGFIGLVFAGLWSFVLFGSKIAPLITAENIAVAKRNLYIPTFFFIISCLLLSVLFVNLSFKRINKLLDKKLLSTLLLLFLFGLTAFDLLRFSQKFTPFTDTAYLFPSTKTLDFLQQQKGQFRIMSTDARIMPPNFSIMYNLQSVDGYDPLYLLRYGEFVAALQRNKPDITPPFGFNRIITPQAYDSRLIDLLGVRYVLSLNDIKSPKLKPVFAEGQTKVYENAQAYPRAFFVETIIPSENKQESITKLFDSAIDLRKTAIVEGSSDFLKDRRLASGTVEILSYKENEVKIRTKNRSEGFLVLMDSYYPTWNVNVCTTQETDCTDLSIFITNYNFRGVFVPAGEHHVIFYNSLL